MERKRSNTGHCDILGPILQVKKKKLTGKLWHPDVQQNEYCNPDLVAPSIQLNSQCHEPQSWKRSHREQDSVVDIASGPHIR